MKKYTNFMISLITLVLFAVLSFGINANAAEEGWIKSSSGGWWYQYSDGTYAKSEYIDGYWINANGWYTSGWYGKWKNNSTGWWFEDGKWYPTNQWLKIDKKWYHFNSSGYMDSKKWIGTYYVGEDGAWIDGYKNEVIILSKLNGIEGIPFILDYNYKDGKNILCESLYGPSLIKIHDFIDEEFEMTTISIIGIQIMNILKSIHEKFIIHNDVNPNNICWGKFLQGILVKKINFF